MLYVRRLIWDDWNIRHIVKKHAVTVEEAEQVCQGNPLLQEGHTGRLLAIGPTTAGRILTVVIDPLGKGVYYPATVRPASRRERAIYAQKKGVKNK